MEVCDLLLRVTPASSKAAAAGWWYRVAAKVRQQPPTFEYEGRRFRWGVVSLYARNTDERRSGSLGWAPVGWRCRRDSGLPEGEISDRMAAREPGAENDFGNAGAARQAGCEIAVYPTRHETLAPWK
jgi:hypothetical protein